ncbi:UNVERIFIED_CONTAM: hypothetical protein GTU68_059524 [Idotea baltica]|nr:hypothetical protein [Idotea baltica]
MAAGFLGFILSLLRIRAKSKLLKRELAAGGTSATADNRLGVPNIGSATGEDSEIGWLGGLQKTRHALFGKLQAILKSSNAVEDIFTQLEELLISSDMGVKTTRALLAKVKEQTESLTPENIRISLQAEILDILSSETEPEIVPAKIGDDPLVIAVVGVNGVGKTTTIGKLAWQFGAQGKKVLIAAGDTFRAAAEQQLEIWAERAGASVVRGAENAKPSTVAYEAVHQAKKGGFDVLIVDTAGRLHTRVNLMNELQNILQIISRELPGSPHETILVVDATTGQNALQQAIDFNECAPLSGIVVTKLDGTPKGGIVVAISNELSIPIRYVGIGEQAVDLKLFSAQEFTDALFAEADEELLEESIRLDSQTGSLVADNEASPGTKKITRRRKHS